MSVASSHTCDAARPSGPLGVGVLGLGDHARRNALPALAACPAVDLVGVHTRAHDRREEAAQRYRCKGYESADDLLRDPAVGVVYLALPIGLHAPWASRALAAGRHVWCEKSLAQDLAAVRALTAAARAAERALCECFMFRHHGQFRHVTERLREGAVGRLRSVTARFGFPHLPTDNVRYAPELGGGALLDAGCYTVCAARALAGGALDAVCAHLDTDPGYRVDTGGAALLRFTSGVYAHLEWGFGRGYRNDLELWGDRGSLFVERAFSKPASLVTRVRLRASAGEDDVHEVPAEDPFVALFTTLAAETEDATSRARWLQEAEAQAEALDAVRRAAAGGGQR